MQLSGYPPPPEMTKHDDNTTGAEGKLPYEPPKIEAIELSDEAAEALT